MQPVQLSLIPDPHPPASRPAVPAGQLPEDGGRRGDRAAGRRDRQSGPAGGDTRWPAMSEHSKVTASHLRRAAVVYVRQSTLAQLERNTESTARQYDLVERAAALGWPREAVRVVDDDLGVSGSALGQRDGLRRAGRRGRAGPGRDRPRAGGLPAGPQQRRLVPAAGSGRRMTDTLIADADGVYHPGLFNDRLVLGMKGTMSEAELHVLRARLTAGSATRPPAASCAAACRSGWSGARPTGRSGLHPDEAVTGVIAAVFDRFAVCGSVRGVLAVAARAGAALAAADRRLPRAGACPRSPGWSRPTTRCTPC